MLIHKCYCYYLIQYIDCDKWNCGSCVSKKHTWSRCAPTKFAVHNVIPLHLELYIDRVKATPSTVDKVWDNPTTARAVRYMIGCPVFINLLITGVLNKEIESQLLLCGTCTTFLQKGNHNRTFLVLIHV